MLRLVRFLVFVFVVVVVPLLSSPVSIRIIGLDIRALQKVVTDVEDASPFIEVGRDNAQIEHISFYHTSKNGQPHLKMEVRGCTQYLQDFAFEYLAPTAMVGALEIGLIDQGDDVAVLVAETVSPTRINLDFDHAFPWKRYTYILRTGDLGKIETYDLRIHFFDYELNCSDQSITNQRVLIITSNLDPDDIQFIQEMIAKLEEEGDDDDDDFGWIEDFFNSVNLMITWPWFFIISKLRDLILVVSVAIAVKSYRNHREYIKLR